MFAWSPRHSPVRADVCVRAHTHSPHTRWRARTHTQSPHTRCARTHARTHNTHTQHEHAHHGRHEARCHQIEQFERKPASLLSVLELTDRTQIGRHRRLVPSHNIHPHPQQPPARLTSVTIADSFLTFFFFFFFEPPAALAGLTGMMPSPAALGSSRTAAKVTIDKRLCRS